MARPGQLFACALGLGAVAMSALAQGRPRRVEVDTEGPASTTGTEKGSAGAFAFTADKSVDHLRYRGVRMHGDAAMWIRFRVAGDVVSPAVTFVAEAEPGRP